MYTIGEIEQLTGITAYTLRYYEKIGVLHQPRRLGANRSYDERDLRYIRFVHGLKQTGMRLEDIAAFTEDGCLLDRDVLDTDTLGTLHKRIDLLEQHVHTLDQQIQQLEAVKAIAAEKTKFYKKLLDEQTGDQ